MDHSQNVPVDRRSPDPAQLILIEQNRLLKQVASGQPLDDCLAVVCDSIARFHPGTRACFLLTDSQRLTFSRSVTSILPSSFGQAIQGLPINDLCIGTCGEAVYRSQPISCADIAHDDRWSQSWRELCVAHGILACHSEPVMGADNLPIGSLMLCFGEARSPTHWEYQLAQFGTQVASIVFERDRANLNRQRFLGVGSDLQVITGNDGYVRWVSPTFEQLLGWTPTEVTSRPWAEFVHPDDVGSSLSQANYILSGNRTHKFENRCLHKDGSYRWLLWKAQPYLEEQVTYGTAVDITERKQAEIEREQFLQREQALRQQAESAEARVQEILASIREDFVLLDRNWQITYLNSQAATTMGVMRGEVLDQRIWDLFPDLVGTEFYNRLHAVMHDRVPTQFEYYDPTLDRWFENRAYPAPDGIVNLSTDITLRKQSELSDQFLDQLDRRLREFSTAAAMMEETVSSLGEFLKVDRVLWDRIDWAANQSIVEQDWRRQEIPSMAGVYQVSDFVLPELADLFHTGQAVVISDVVTDSLTADSADNFLSLNIRALLSIPSVYEGRWVATLSVTSTTTREWRPAEVALLQETVARLWSMIEYVRAVEDLRHSETEFRRLANLMPQIVWITGANGELEFVNDRWTEYTGLNLEQSRDRTLVTQIIPPEDSEELSIAFAQAQQSKSIYQSGFRIIQPNGGYRYFLARATPICDEQGQILKWYGTSTDITELKQLEAQRDRSLAQEQRAREAAEQANRIKDEFLAVLSHELRSPLNPILGWTRMLQTGRLDALKTKQALDTIERNAKLQTELIADLLDVSRILQGKLSLTIHPVNLASTIEAAIETVALAAEAKAIQVQTALEAVGKVSGDSSRLQQVVWNLVSNAVKFTPEGGRVEVGLTRVDNCAQITVTDNGKGITSEFLPHVFDYFRQEDGAITRRFGGLGLGLAIVRHLTELHGGTISATSDGEGQGATFTVKLPLLKHSVENETQKSQRTSAIGSEVPLSGIWAIVVDDEPDMREIISFVMEKAGAQVTTVSKGSEVLALLTQADLGDKQPDLLLSDVGMPEMDGYMLLRQIRALPSEQGGQILAIALTAYAGDFNQQQAMQAGFQWHIAKPVDPDQLIQAIVNLLGSEPFPVA
jgi:PAS domain S-box-containing protein